MHQPLRLLEVDPELASAINDPARQKRALRQVTARPLELVPGDQLDAGKVASEATLGAIVLSGFLVREWTAGGRVSADLLGPEDVVRVDGSEPVVAMLRHAVSWTALTEVQLALLDEGFLERAARWPEIGVVLLDRAARLGERLSLRGAISTLPSVDARLLATLWLWASQWATVAGRGVVLRVPLSHERLARLIHARRPTVTTSIGRLRRSGLIDQHEDGSWVLRGLEPGKDASWEGVAMPVLADMRAPALRVRSASARRKGDNSPEIAARELQAQVAEQRKALRAATKRHEEMLALMRMMGG